MTEPFLKYDSYSLFHLFFAEKFDPVYNSNLPFG